MIAKEDGQPGDWWLAFDGGVGSPVVIVEVQTQDTVPPKLKSLKEVSERILPRQGHDSRTRYQYCGRGRPGELRRPWRESFPRNFSKQERAAPEAWWTTQDPDFVINVRFTLETGPTQDAPKVP